MSICEKIGMLFFSERKAYAADDDLTIDITVHDVSNSISNTYTI